MKVLIITQHSLPAWKQNMNAYQRPFFGSQFAEVRLLIRRNRTVSEDLRARVKVHESPVAWRPLFFVYACAYAALLRLRGGLDVVITEPSGFALIGFFTRRLLGIKWALDLWDRPKWRPGGHETTPKWSDRLLFRAMRTADLHILSVLPPAVKDIDPPPDRCVRLPNAIDPAQRAESIPSRSPDDLTLHLAYARGRFYPTMGLDVVVHAVEQATDRGADIRVHLVGLLSSEAESLIANSISAGSIETHGRIDESRSEFFRGVHVGLVPYLPVEDLRYIFPIKVLEHFSQGNPVIASDLPGLASMVRHEVNGLLVKPGDEGSLADAIERLWKDFALWEELARGALASMDEYDAQSKNQRIFEAIQGLMP